MAMPKTSVHFVHKQFGKVRICPNGSLTDTVLWRRVKEIGTTCIEQNRNRNYK